MKTIYRYITFLLLSLPILGQSQTYIQGENMLPFSEVASSIYLQQNERIPLEEAFVIRKKILENSVLKDVVKIVGEYYMQDDLLISTVCSELAVIQKNKYPGIYSNYLYLKHDSDPEHQFLSYEDLGAYKTMISYNRSSNYLSYYVENSTYSITGAVYAPQDKISEGQKFIEKLVESITFKN